jgi:hypothetical protein
VSNQGSEFLYRYFSPLSEDAAEIKNGDSNFIFEIPAFVAPSGETTNKFNKHLGLILDFMWKGVQMKTSTETERNR